MIRVESERTAIFICPLVCIIAWWASSVKDDGFTIVHPSAHLGSTGYCQGLCAKPNKYHDQNGFCEAEQAPDLFGWVTNQCTVRPAVKGALLLTMPLTGS